MRQTALNTVYEIAKKNPKVVFIGSDLGVGTLQQMKIDLPNQFFMEGISEQHIIGFAAGLAKEGYIPFLNTIANFFSRRALEQIILDVALHKLPVKIMASGGGMVYAPLGPTHTATDDLAHILLIPNINVYAPCDANEMKQLIISEIESQLPAYIRFGKGSEELLSDKFLLSNDNSFKFIGDLEAKRIIITTGVTVQPAFHAIKNSNFASEVLLIHIMKLNLDNSNDLKLVLQNKDRILILEEHQKNGGLLSQILHYCFDQSISISNISSISLGQNFVRKYGSQTDHFKYFGMTSEHILEEVMR